MYVLLYSFHSFVCVNVIPYGKTYKVSYSFSSAPLHSYHDHRLAISYCETHATGTLNSPVTMHTPWLSSRYHALSFIILLKGQSHTVFVYFFHEIPSPRPNRHGWKLFLILSDIRGVVELFLFTIYSTPLCTAFVTGKSIRIPLVT
jgi:hypothetical protein